MHPDLADIARAAQAHSLEVFGLCHEGEETLVLLGPSEPGFWAGFTASAEYRDGAADPLDRWSKRVIGDLADQFGATAHFPSDGPPYPPFIGWAVASGRAWKSPVGMLVHDRAGLFVSYRGALRLSGHIPLDAPKPPPCDSCAAQPCRSACPVDALGPSAYDTARCKDHLRRVDSAACAPSGCAARRACPISQDYGRMPAQSAFHMDAFLRN